jgi:hypothetical protein
MHVYEIRPRKDKRGVDLTSDVLPFGRLWYTKQDDAVEYAKFFSRSHHAVIRVYDDAGNVINLHRNNPPCWVLFRTCSETSRRDYRRRTMKKATA